MDLLVYVGGALAIWAVTGALLTRRPRHPVTLTLAVMSVALGLALLTPLDETHGNALWLLGPPVMLAVLLVVFPDGPRGRWWRRVLRYQVVVLLWSTVAAVLWPDGGPPLGALAIGLPLALFLPIGVAAVVSLVRLRRRSTGSRRVRIGLVLAAGAAVASTYLLAGPVMLAVRGAWPQASRLQDLYAVATFALLPVAVGLSVLVEPTASRQARWDRVWSVLLGAGGALFTGGAVAGAVEVADPDAPAAVLVCAAALAVAVAAAAAGWVHRRGSALRPPSPDRATTGLRDLAARLAAAPAPDEVLPLVAATVGTTLELQGAAVDVQVGPARERLATWGRPDGRELERPLEHAGQVVGRLVLVPHPDGVPVDLSALDELLAPVAAVVAAARLTTELERAHGRLVRIRDDERARLRADLHDELSPSLSGVRLAVAAARERLEAGDTDGAAALLSRVEDETSRAGGVVTGILEDLRPDDLVRRGLLAAVRDRAAALSRPGAFEVTVEAGPDLPAVTPETEVAVYRTATEAVANAARHSGGRHCRVRLTAGDGALVLEVADDGTGLPATAPPRPGGGVGLPSMAARAEAVGGRLRVGTRTDGGAEVQAHFPAGTP
ncbi:Histidine kinase [Geodermatophilus saharensis]|uniref:Histidine kinase n=1 Tax=Geodermatophilus saharensis TaxID=1137994 RepID=A0A239BSQ8_9ACTN|nr:ATP-binding protein [Geodermatophilus saharensis]SNS10719.1 Histidine kinase [Geodermatophilus saharensis]